MSNRRDVHKHPVIKGVDARLHNETVIALADSGLKIDIYPTCRAWGNIGNFLSRLRVLEHQVTHSIPYQIALEDDSEITDPSLVFNNRLKHVADTHDLVVLGNWGEAYATSLRGAKETVAKIYASGLRFCPDHQMNTNVANMNHTRSIFRGSVRSTFRKTNFGCISKTGRMKRQVHDCLRDVTASSIRGIERRELALGCLDKR